MKYLILFLSLSIYFLASCSNKKKSTTTAVPIKPSGIVTPLPGQTVEPTIGLNLGNHSPEIAQNNLNDSIIKLSSLKGKLVLIDFYCFFKRIKYVIRALYILNVYNIILKFNYILAYSNLLSFY